MSLFDGLKNLLSKTAWAMVPPQPYSAFHLLFTLIGVTASCVLAFRLAKPSRQAVHTGYGQRLLFTCGLLLAFMELYKQLFLYFIVNNGHYVWWYFPFQLCSIPMYLCLLYPWCKSPKIRQSFAVFIQDFGLLGGLMALLVPPGLMYPYWTLTLHSFFWHFILIFLGLFCARAGLTELTPRSYLRVFPLFLLCCLAAFSINLLAGPEANADMFYISPYHPSTQPVFHEISRILGILPGNILYLGAVLLGGFLVHCALRFLRA